MSKRKAYIIRKKDGSPIKNPVKATSGKTLQRNDPCFCGSGKKYKNCHWEYVNGVERYKNKTNED